MPTAALTATGPATGPAGVRNRTDPGLRRVVTVTAVPTNRVPGARTIPRRVVNIDRAVKAAAGGADTAGAGRGGDAGAGAGTEDRSKGRTAGANGR